MVAPQLPNERWSLDFVADQFVDGHRLRILVVVDDCAFIPDTLGIRSPPSSIGFSSSGKTGTIVRDNGTEPSPNAISWIG